MRRTRKYSLLMRILIRCSRRSPAPWQLGHNRQNERNSNGNTDKIALEVGEQTQVKTQWK